MLLRKTRLLTIDKGAGTITLVVKGVTGGKTLSYNVADVAKLQLVSQYEMHRTATGPGGPGSGLSIGTGGMGAGGTTSTEQTTRLLLVMRDGTNVDIADGSRSMNGMAIVSKVPNQDIGQRIATFLGVPFEVVDPNTPTLGSVVADVQGMMHHNDTAPSVAPQQPVSPAANPTNQVPVNPAVPPAVPNGPGFAMPNAPAPTQPVAEAPVAETPSNEVQPPPS